MHVDKPTASTQGADASRRPHCEHTSSHTQAAAQSHIRCYKAREHESMLQRCPVTPSPHGPLTLSSRTHLTCTVVLVLYICWPLVLTLASGCNSFEGSLSVQRTRTDQPNCMQLPEGMYWKLLDRLPGHSSAPDLARRALQPRYQGVLCGLGAQGREPGHTGLLPAEHKGFLLAVHPRKTTQLVSVVPDESSYRSAWCRCAHGRAARALAPGRAVVPTLQ